MRLYEVVAAAFAFLFGQEAVQQPEFEFYNSASPISLLANWVEIKLPVNSTNKTNDFCTRMEPGPQTHDYPQVLKKRAFDDRPTFFFIAGLEGTGHHFMQKVFRRCKSCRCIWDWEDNRKLKEFSLAKFQNIKGFFGSNVTKQDYEWMLTDFSRKAEKWKTKLTEKRPMVILNSKCGDDGWSQGMLSYPNFGGKCKDFQYPDVRMLAELMGTQRMNFKVVVILRNSIDVLLSTTVHRSMGSLEQVVERYRNMADLLYYKQLMRLDRRFFECLDYDQFPSVPEGFLDFAGFRKFDFDFEEMVTELFGSKRTKEEREQERREFIERDVQNKSRVMIEAVNNIRRLCGFKPESQFS